MSDIEGKLEAIEVRFQKGSKQYDAARYIVRQNRKIPKDEQEKICQEIPIAKKSLQGLFTELKKMGLYPPQKTVEKPKQAPVPKKPQESSDNGTEEAKPPLQEYATREDIEILRNSINYLASVISGNEPSNPGELETVIRGEGLSNPGEPEEERDIQMLEPEELVIQDASLKKDSVWLTPLTLTYFDQAKQGVFDIYPGTREESPFAKFYKKHPEFKGPLTLSDFFNNTVVDYFTRVQNTVIGVKEWRPLR